MPNQRKKGKAQIAAWVTDDVAKRVRKIAEAEGRPISDVVKDILTEWVVKEEGKNYGCKSKHRG